MAVIANQMLLKHISRVRKELGTLPIGFHIWNRNFILILLSAGVMFISVSCKKDEMILKQSKIVPVNKQESSELENKDISGQNSPCLDKNVRTAAQSETL